MEDLRKKYRLLAYEYNISENAFLCKIVEYKQLKEMMNIVNYLEGHQIGYKIDEYANIRIKN
jgi:hypothetical protein